jgi:hypothetical protein
MFGDTACRSSQRKIKGRLDGMGIKCFVTGGNDDEWDVLNVIKKEDAKSFIACENEMVHVDEDHTRSYSRIPIGCNDRAHYLCQPGSEYGEGILHGCLVTFVDEEVMGFQMTSG